jgi:LPS export ABC transporter protein LptC
MININTHIKNILVLFCCCFLFSCGTKEKAVVIDTTKKVGVEEGKDIVIKYSVGNNRKAFLKAPLMYRVADTVIYTEFPKKVHVDFFGANDSIESKLDAHYAKYIENESKVFLKDSVTVINIKGDTLHCKTLYWDRNRTGKEFYTDDSIRIRTKTQIIDGIGLDAQQDFKSWHIVKPIGFIEVQNSQVPN